MKKRRWILPAGIAGGVILLCIAAAVIFGVSMRSKGFEFSTGRMYFADNCTYLIEGNDVALRVSDCSDNMKLFNGCKSGDRVVLLHDGIDDSYPAQTGGYRIFRLSKGDGSYKPADELLGVVKTLNEDGAITSAQQDSHSPAKEAQTVENPISEYCGNTVTTINFDDGKSYTFMFNNSVAVTDILVNLKYDVNKLCKCLPKYKVDTEFGSYGVSLGSGDEGGYARCEKGQADLTREQTDKLREIIMWASEEAEKEQAGVN